MAWQLWLSLGIVVFLCINQFQCLAEESGSEEAVSAGSKDASSDTQDTIDASSETQEAVLTLTADNFAATIESTAATILVEFYAPWCGHCKQLIPIYEEAAQKLKDHDPPIVLAKVDAEAEKDLGEQFEVQGYPTLKIFKNGKNYDFEGPRTTDGIVSEMSKVSQPTWKPPQDPVLDLTSQNFDAAISKHSLIMVEFYAPWCGHCKKFAPKYKEIATALKKNNPPIPIAKVDATKHSEVAERYGVKGYPTIKVFRNGKDFPYEGEREVHAIIQKMKDYLKPDVTLLSTAVKFQNFLSPTDVRVVGFFQDNSSPVAEAFFGAAKTLRDSFELGYVESKSVSDELGYSNDEILLFYPTNLKNDYEDAFIRFNGEANAENIELFVEEKKNSLVSVNMAESDFVQNKDDERVRVNVYSEIDFSPANNNQDAVKETLFWYNKVLKVANKYKENQNIVFSFAHALAFTKEISAMGLDKSGDDVNVGIWGPKNTKYPFQGDTFSDLEDHLEKVIAGKAKSYIKSAKKPKKNKGPVKIVVGKTFNKIVNSKKKDVLIEFYAPWCGHCKSLVPIYQKLGALFKKEKHIVIAKIDATANDYPGIYDVSSFPTIYFAKSGSKDTPLKYTFNRELRDFTRFLGDHSTKPITTVEIPPADTGIPDIPPPEGGMHTPSEGGIPPPESADDGIGEIPESHMPPTDDEEQNYKEEL